MRSPIARSWALGFCDQIQCFFCIIGHSDLIFRLWNWPRSPAGSSSTNSYNKTGLCWSEPRALCGIPRRMPYCYHAGLPGTDGEKTQNVLPPASVVRTHTNRGAAKAKWKGSNLPPERQTAIWPEGNYLSFNHSYAGFEAAPKEFLLCLEELDSFRSEFCHLSVSWPTDKGLLSAIRQLIDVLHAWGKDSRDVLEPPERQGGESKGDGWNFHLQE